MASDESVSGINCLIQGSHFRFEKRIGCLDLQARRALAVEIINLVNLEGATSVFISTTSFLKAIEHSLNEVDYTGRWHQWVKDTFGKELQLLPATDENQKSQIGNGGFRIPEDSLKSPTTGVGVNIGGYFGRLAHIDASGRVSYGPELRLMREAGSVFSSISSERFCKIVSSWVHDTYPHCEFVGFAWAAPRGNSGIKVHLQHLFNANDQLKEAFKTDTIRKSLTQMLGCPVSFWNDGEAVAVADWHALGKSHSPHTTISLKLGTSVACGAVIDSSLCLLPLEIAKCIVFPEPRTASGETIHPGVHLQGTLREAVGARAVAMRHFGVDKAAHCFLAFQQDALAKEPKALEQVRHMADALFNSAKLLTRAFGGFRLVLGGKTMEGDFGHLLASVLVEQASRHSTPSGRGQFQIMLTPWAATYVAAVGAGLLARFIHPHSDFMANNIEI